jgi:hypothetical protein
MTPIEIFAYLLLAASMLPCAVATIAHQVGMERAVTLAATVRSRTYDPQCIFRERVVQPALERAYARRLAYSRRRAIMERVFAIKPDVTLDTAQRITERVYALMYA